MITTHLIYRYGKKGYKIPGGTPYTPNGFMTFVGASAMINGKTQGAFPAAKALLSAVYEGALVPFDLALKVEARWFTNVIMNPSSSAMIRSLFINKSALEKGAVRPKDVSDQSVLVWQKSNTLHLSFGYKLIVGEYPFGGQAHLLPTFNIKFGW